MLRLYAIIGRISKPDLFYHISVGKSLLQGCKVGKKSFRDTVSDVINEKEVEITVV